MEDIDNVVEHRGLFVSRAERSGHPIVKELTERFGMCFEFASTYERIAQSLYTFEPMLILAEHDPVVLELLAQASALGKYRQSVTILLTDTLLRDLDGLDGQPAVSGVFRLTGNAKRDSIDLFSSYREKLRYGINLKAASGGMPIVTELIWNDSSKRERAMRKALSDKLERLGVGKTLSGHKYLMAAVAIQSASFSAPVPIKLYECIGDYYDKSAASVEKAIRYAIETAWTHGDINYQYSLFGMSIDEDRGKPTNAEFIARLAIDY